jgi:hypothetical protein
MREFYEHGDEQGVFKNRFHLDNSQVFRPLCV